MDRYRIKPGASFKLPDGTLKTAGDEIDLPSDVAASHAGSLDKVGPVPTPETPLQADQAAQ